MKLVTAIIVLIVVIVAVYLAVKHSRVRRGTSRSHLRNQLVNMVMGDKETASRLIEFESKRNPNASEAELIRAAIDRLQRDRR